MFHRAVAAIARDYGKNIMKVSEVFNKSEIDIAKSDKL